MRRPRAAGRIPLLALAVLLGCAGPPGDTLEPGSLPADGTATPEDVVRAYLGALQDGDAAAATALTAPPYADTDRWPADPPRIADVVVEPATGQPTTGTAAQGYAEAVSVRVSFDLHGADETMPDGPTSWGYVLARDDADAPWRIVDAGNG
ncbi:hypothetical protein ACFFKU_09990 [Kineococcus gynurae]|uniref:DUF4829 domain-containing protein n=1 Tax=Kineococcus gynurae TaxID=452979 RepID=A0ABV5LV66_9ACTN